MALKNIISCKKSTGQLRFWTLLICLMAGYAMNASAQRDLIVTQAGEEIRCRILDETPTRFIYAYLGKKEKVLRNEIFKNLVTSFKYNYYDSDLIRTDKLPGGQRNTDKKAKRVDTRRTRSTNDTNASKDIDARSEVEPEKKERITRKEKKIRKEGKDLSNENGIESKLSSQPEEKEAKKEKKSRKDRKKKDVVKADSAVVDKSQEPLNDVEFKEVASTFQENTPLNRSKNSNENGDNTPREDNSQESTPQLEVESKSIESEAVQADIEEVSKKELKKARKELKKQQKEKEPQVAKRVKKIENEELLIEPELTNEFKNYLKWRVGVKGGLSNIINTTVESTNAYDLYREDLLKGWTFGADAAYFITEGFGVGAMFTNFMTSNKAEGLTYPNLLTNTTVDDGSIETKISNKYVGPAFYFRKGIDFKTFVVLGLSPGMYFYNESGAYNTDNFNFTSQQFGGAATLGLDFLLGNDIIGRDVILSLEAGYNYSRFNEIDYGGTRGMETLASPLIMDRLDFSIGLRFMRFPRYLRSK